jgi:hypothetical protein
MLSMLIFSKNPEKHKSWHFVIMQPVIRISAGQAQTEAVSLVPHGTEY